MVDTIAVLAGIAAIVACLVAAMTCFYRERMAAGVGFLVLAPIAYVLAVALTVFVIAFGVLAFAVYAIGSGD